jgi:hypothetical protein
MDQQLRNITTDLTYALAQLSGDPGVDRLRQARDAIRRSADMLDQLLAKAETWTVDEILEREG